MINQCQQKSAPARCKKDSPCPCICGAALPLDENNPRRYRIETTDGEVAIAEYQVFPGIWLVRHRAHARSFQYITGHPQGLLEITHCREGRLEFEEENRFFYLGAGDMSVHRSGGSCVTLRCPTGYYDGVSIRIDPGLAPRCTSCFLKDVEVDLPSIGQKFCAGGGLFLLRSTPRLAHIFSEIYEVPETIWKGYFKVKVLELLLFLSQLDPILSQAEQRACSSGQLLLVRQAFALLRAERHKRWTAAQLATALHVSPEQLRRSVKNVYGKPLYQCIRAHKMHMAAERLLQSDRTITDIAGELGYDNSSKFAHAFREVFGLSPTDYRLRQSPDNHPDCHFGAKNI